MANAQLGTNGVTPHGEEFVVIHMHVSVTRAHHSNVAHGIGGCPIAIIVAVDEVSVHTLCVDSIFQSTVLVTINVAHSEHVALACASAVREVVGGKVSYMYSAGFAIDGI